MIPYIRIILLQPRDYRRTVEPEECVHLVFLRQRRNKRIGRVLLLVVPDHLLRKFIIGLAIAVLVTIGSLFATYRAQKHRRLLEALPTSATQGVFIGQQTMGGGGSDRFGHVVDAFAEVEADHVGEDLKDIPEVGEVVVENDVIKVNAMADITKDNVDSFGF